MRGIDLRPGVDDRHNLGSRQIGQRQVVCGGKGEDVAFAYDGLGAEEEGFVFCSCFSLLIRSLFLSIK
jgi:hypothetical protein